MSGSILYEACRAGDIHTVQQLLSELSINEINQVEPNGSTCLHAASSCNHPQIVKLLLDSGAVRSMVNKEGRTALDVAATEEIKQLFSRPFAVAQARFLTDISPEQSIEWSSSKYGRYGWWYKSNMYDDDVSLAVDRILEDRRFFDTASTHKIEFFFNQARQTQDPKWLIQAYTAETGIYQVINRAFAQIPCDDPSWESSSDFRTFASVLSLHKGLEQCRYTGKCYRGMKITTEDFAKNYKIGRKLLIKPFMSTSKSREKAERFAISSPSGSQYLSILFIYTIPERTMEYLDNVALDISSISEYQDEEEVLILPCTSLKIQALNQLPSGLIEVEVEWYSYSSYK